MYPRRVKDLPRLETDSEDEINTPLKSASSFESGQLKSSAQCNKENQINANNLSCSSNNNTFGKFRNYPKRSSELPALESDSDEEENLNCAILNDSFLLTPGKYDADQNTAPSSPMEESRSSDNTKNAFKLENNAANVSLLARFDKMGLGAEIEPAKSEVKSNSLTSNTASTKTINKIIVNEHKQQSTSFCHLNSIAEDKELAQVKRYNSEPEPVSCEPQTTLEQETPFKLATNVGALTTSTEGQFATPQIRSFPVHRRPRDICSTQSQKTRSAIVNEFRSQKVLFQTPMAITRQPILTNDSITLSLCDSISEQQECTPIKTENVSSLCRTTGELDPTSGKSKKSLDGAFNEFDPSAGALAASENKLSNTNVAKGVSSISTTLSAISSVSKTVVNKARDTILKINNSSYEVLHKLGTGGSSSVYLAKSIDSGKECAIKIVDLRGDAAVVEGYLNETRLLAKLQGNSCVVSLYDYQLLQKESKLYMVMEKGDSDLHKILQGYRTSLPLYVLMNLWYQMLQAVNYIHQNGVIHSDLKPANFLMANNRLKLIDFGIASNIAIDSTSIIKFSQAGTFNYISPEALTDTSTGSSPNRNQPKIKISTKSDVWSLGCILYLLIYKKTPFSHILNIYAKISAISSPTPSIAYPPMEPYYPEILLHMVKSCLQHNPKKRPSCAELLQYPFDMIIPIKNIIAPK